MDRMWNRLGWLVAAVLTIGIIAAVARVAQGGPIDPPGPVAETQEHLIFNPKSCPQLTPINLASPGAYRLAEDITGCNSGIQISSSDVTLDLGGFTLAEPLSAFCGAVNCERIDVRNGSITEYQGTSAGVQFTGASHSTLHDLTISVSSNYTQLGSYNTLADCVVAGQVSLDAYDTIEHCAISTGNVSPGWAVYMFGPGDIVRNNSLKVGQISAIEMRNVLNSVSGNTITCEYGGPNGSIGVYMSGSSGGLVRGNKIGQCDRGIYVDGDSKSNVIEENVVSANGQGITALDNATPLQKNVFLRNVATANGGGAANYNISTVGNDVAPAAVAASATNPETNVSN
jgi:parallel beta-helix repeat protein